MAARAKRVRTYYAEYEQATFGRAWTREELVLGLLGDIGDLAKAVQGFNGVRSMQDPRDKLQHELGDVLWSVLVIAQAYDVDIEIAFGNLMTSLEDLYEDFKSGRLPGNTRP